MQAYEEQLSKLLDTSDIHGTCAFVADANGEYIVTTNIQNFTSSKDALLIRGLILSRGDII